MLKQTSVVLCLFVLFTLAASADDLGTYKIPDNVKYGGTVITAGMYLIQIMQESEGAFLQLSQNGNVIARDRVIVIPARIQAAQDNVQIFNPAGKHFIRIRIRHSMNWYFAYLQKTR